MVPSFKTGVALDACTMPMPWTVFLMTDFCCVIYIILYIILYIYIYIYIYIYPDIGKSQIYFTGQRHPVIGRPFIHSPEHDDGYCHPDCHDVHLDCHHEHEIIKIVTIISMIELKINHLDYNV